MNATATIENQVINVYSNRIENLQAQIEASRQRELELERELEEQRRKTEQLKQHEQAQLTAKSAAIAALKEVINAFRLADGIDPTGETANELLDTIGNVREAIWNGSDLPQLPGEETEGDATDEPTPQPEPSDDDAIEVEVKEESIGDRVEQVKEANGLAPTVPASELASISYKVLRKAAQLVNVPAKGKRSELAQRLKNKVTAEILEEAKKHS